MLKVFLIKITLSVGIHHMCDIQHIESISDPYRIPCQWKYLRYDHTTVKFVYVIYLWKVLSL